MRVEDAFSEELVVRDVDEALVRDDAVGIFVVLCPVVLQPSDDLVVDLLAVPAYLLEDLVFIAEGQPTHIGKSRRREKC